MQRDVAEPIVAPDVPGVPVPPVNSNVRSLRQGSMAGRHCIEVQIRGGYVQEQQRVARAWRHCAGKAALIGREAEAAAI